MSAIMVGPGSLCTSIPSRSPLSFGQRANAGLNSRSSEVPTPSNPMREVSGEGGGMSGQKFSKFGNDVDGSRLVGFLTKLHPQKTADCVAADTGVPASTVRKWLAGDTTPGFAATHRLIATYGAAFIAAAMGFNLMEMVERMCAENERALAEGEREIAARRARNEELRATLAK
jgi:hypothetical protein